MTATCWPALPICAEMDEADHALATRAGFGGWTRALLSRAPHTEPILLANVFNLLQGALLDVAVKEFVDTISRIPEVEEAVLFHDVEGPHLWTAISSRDWDAETEVLAAQSRLRQSYHEDIELFSLVASADELEASLPIGFIRLYAKN
jgi:hypothetical protein